MALTNDEQKKVLEVFDLVLGDYVGTLDSFAESASDVKVVALVEGMYLIGRELGIDAVPFDVDNLKEKYGL